MSGVVYDAAVLVAADRSERRSWADVVDAVVVTVALRNQAVILTDDPVDMERLVRTPVAKPSS